MTEVSWPIFEAKFSGKTQAAFQDLCLYVFCHICGLKTGVSSYSDHPGIETEDVLFQGKYTGFQAKFYTDNLPQKKKDILEAITTTRAHNTRVQKIIFFLPINPSGVSSGIDEGQKPQWMKEAEATAKNNHLEIEWFGTSRFQVVLACEDLQLIARHFFDQSPDLWDFILVLKKLTKMRLSVIRDSINYNESNIHLEHQHELERLDNLNPKAITIISGVGGVGKTAIVKDWLGRQVSDKTFAIVLQTNEVLEHFYDANMAKAWHATLDDFLKVVSRKYDNCVLVVDSVEKLANGQELSALLMVLHRFLDSPWKIVLTTRTLFEQQIVSHFKTFMPEASLEVLKVCPIHADELLALSAKYGFPLPANDQVRNSIRTAFNLSAYLSCKQANDATSLQTFRDMIWSHFVLGDDPTDTAGQTFCTYVEEKLRKDVHVIVVDSPSEDTKLLVGREIIARRENGTGYVIAHDIYEEWAAVRALDGKLQELGFSEFERYIASSHGLRRGLQLQVEQRLAGMGEDEDPFLTLLLATKSDILRSDLILALIRSEHIGKFLKCYTKTLLAGDASILESIIAGAYNFGRGLDTVSMLLNRKRPEGFSWRAIIDFAYANQAALQEIATPMLLPLMTDWVLSNPNDEAVATCCCFAWKAVELGEPSRAYSYHWDKQLTELILSTSGHDKEKFESEIRGHLAITERRERNRVLDTLCKHILLESWTSPCIIAIKEFPGLVRDIALAYWRNPHNFREEYHSLDKIEYDYGLPAYGFKYFPPSSLQGPTYALLKMDPIKTIVFIVDFVNARVADAAKANPKRFDSITLVMPDGKKVNQKISFGLWDCYRDKGFGEHVPYLLKAMHMALERYLLELAEDRGNDEICECILCLLLRRSISASLTAVVASIVMAHPMEFVKVGLVLISERQVLLCDSCRLFAESRPDVTRAILPFPKREHDFVRDEADKHPVRRVSFENVIWQYQIIGSKKVPDLKEKVQKILDGYESDWDNLSQEDKFYFTRVDVRRQNISVSVDDKTNQATINAEPILSPDMQERKKENDDFSADQIRMVKLAQWGNERLHGQLPKTGDEYSDINNVLKDFQWLLDKTGAVVDNQDVVSMAAHRATAAALIMFHYDEMPRCLCKTCKRIVLTALDLVLSDQYIPVKWDRVGESIFVIPCLLSHLSWRERKLVAQRFVMSLLNENFNDLIGGDRICDWGMAGVRVYCDRNQDKPFRRYIMKMYRRQFLRYHSYSRHLRPPWSESLIWKMRIVLCNILEKLHMPIPSRLLVHEWMAPMHRMAYHNILRVYAKSFWVRHRLVVRPTENDVLHLACNSIGFYFPTKIDNDDEREIVSDVKRVLDYLFCDEKKYGGTSELLYLSQMGRVYMKHLGYCAINMSHSGRQKLLGELAKVPRAFQKPEMIDKILSAQYVQPQTDNFLRLWNGLLPIVQAVLVKDFCSHYDSQQVLDVMALNPLYLNGDEMVWVNVDADISAYFDSLVAQCGNHRYLTVSVMKFVGGAGKRFLLQSLKWINQILIQSQNEYDYDGNNAKMITAEFEHIVPLIKNRINEINADSEARNRLISILDYLITKNSLSAFQMREMLQEFQHPPVTQ